jgi:predicted TIM-barrel fold metal-dependent hydrolase
MTAHDRRQAMPGLAFIDTHHHFQDVTRFNYPWLMDRTRPPPLEGDLEPIRRSYLPPDHEQDLAGATLIQSVHVENGWDRRDPVGETRWLQSLRPSAPHLAAIVAYADLAAPDVDVVLDAHEAASPLLRGIRQSLNWHVTPSLRFCASPGLMDDAAWRSGFALLQPRGLSFDLQIYWPQMAMAARLAADFPDTTIILDHMGMPIDRSADGVRSWQSALHTLAQAPNVYVKLSGFGLGAPHWTVTDLLPLLDRVLQTFGPARCMVGTNLPVDRLFATGLTIRGAIAAAVAPLTENEREAVLVDTAKSVYRIENTAPLVRT